MTWLFWHIMKNTITCHVAWSGNTFSLCPFPYTLITLNFLIILCVALHFPVSDICPFCYLHDFTKFVGNEFPAQLDQVLGLGVSPWTSLVRGILALLKRSFVLEGWGVAFREGSSQFKLSIFFNWPLFWDVTISSTSWSFNCSLAKGKEKKL